MSWKLHYLVISGCLLQIFSPKARRQQSWTPIPAELVGHFPDEVEVVFSFVRLDPRSWRYKKRILRPLHLRKQHRRLEACANVVSSKNEQFRHIKAVFHLRVFCMSKQLAVERNRGCSVHTQELQGNSFFVYHMTSNCKREKTKRSWCWQQCWIKSSDWKGCHNSFYLGYLRSSVFINW